MKHGGKINIISPVTFEYKFQEWPPSSFPLTIIILSHVQTNIHLKTNQMSNITSSERLRSFILNNTKRVTTLFLFLVIIFSVKI